MHQSTSGSEDGSIRLWVILPTVYTAYVMGTSFSLTLAETNLTNIKVLSKDSNNLSQLFQQKGAIGYDNLVIEEEAENEPMALMQAPQPAFTSTFSKPQSQKIQKQSIFQQPAIQQLSSVTASTFSQLPAGHQQRLLVLDVEGTIIEGYDYESPMMNEHFLAVIDPRLNNQLALLKQQGWLIVLATGTDSQQMDYYVDEFQRHQISPYIDHFLPKQHEPQDGKLDKLNKYAAQFDLAKENVYFFDDGPGNVSNTQQAGYTNSFQVSAQHKLCDLLDRHILSQIQAPAPKQQKRPVSPHASSASLFSSQPSQFFYDFLSIEFRQWFSQWSQTARHCFNPHPSAETFWNQLPYAQKQIIAHHTQCMRLKKDPSKVSIERFVDVKALQFEQASYQGTGKPKKCCIF